MASHDYPRKIQYIVNDLEDRLIGPQRREWDRISVEQSDAYGRPLYTIRAQRNVGTLAEETLTIFHTPTAFVSAYKTGIGATREYKTRKQLAIHELYRQWWYGEEAR